MHFLPPTPVCNALPLYSPSHELSAFKATDAQRGQETCDRSYNSGSQGQEPGTGAVCGHSRPGCTLMARGRLLEVPPPIPSVTGLGCPGDMQSPASVVVPSLDRAALFIPCSLAVGNQQGDDQHHLCLVAA